MQELTAVKDMSFDQVPAEMKTKVFGVEYICIVFPDNGQLYVTRYGWPLLEHLLPERWYEPVLRGEGPAHVRRCGSSISCSRF